MLLAELVPWTAKRLAVRTPAKMWAFNPSIVRHGDRTLCSVRLANYHMPGATPASDNPARSFSRCAILELDDELEIIRQGIINERDLGGARDDEASRVSRGFEDYRLFTIGAELHASASSACTCAPTLSIIEISHLRLQEFWTIDTDPATEPSERLARSSPDPLPSARLARSSPDPAWTIASATPLRGTWSRTHQKNWMPYIDHPSGAPRWLYSVDRGGVHGAAGRLVAPREVAAAVAELTPVGHSPTPQRPRVARASILHNNGGAESRIFSGRRGGRPGSHDTHGRASHALRGGTQLVRIPDSMTWLGMAHGYRGDGARKFYWHVWIAVDAEGNLRGTSKPFKLCSAGIEFAAGLVIDPASGQIAVSYGVDDDSAWVGVGRLSDAIGMLPAHAIV